MTGISGSWQCNNRAGCNRPCPRGRGAGRAKRCRPFVYCLKVVRGLSIKAGFCDLGQRFVACFMARFLNFYLSRLPQHGKR